MVYFVLQPISWINNNKLIRIAPYVTSEALWPGSVLVGRGRRESLVKKECL